MVADYNYENRPAFNYKTVPDYNYKTRSAYNYEWRAKYNYKMRSVYNYEWNQVQKNREVFNYKERDVFNYEDRDVFNYKPVHATRTRQITQTRPPDWVCPGGFDPINNSERCSKQTVTFKLLLHDCPLTHPIKAPVFMCHRLELVDPTGCPTYLLVEVNSGWFCRPANAAPFGPSGNATLANDARHSYVSIEPNKKERDLWQPIFRGPGGEQVYDHTDIELYESIISNHGTGEPPDVDVRWHVTPEAASIGEYTCDHKGSSGICISAQIRIHDDAYFYPGMTELLRNNLVCHELGHSVGFNDGGTSSTSCMTGGNNNKLDPYEIRAINLQY